MFRKISVNIVSFIDGIVMDSRSKFVKELFCFNPSLSDLIISGLKVLFCITNDSTELFLSSVNISLLISSLTFSFDSRAIVD